MRKQFIGVLIDPTVIAEMRTRATAQNKTLSAVLREALSKGLGE